MNMLTGMKAKYNAVVQTKSKQIVPIHLGFGIAQSKDYIIQVAKDTCEKIYGEACDNVQVIVDLLEQRVVYSVHKNTRQTIAILAKVS